MTPTQLCVIHTFNTRKKRQSDPDCRSDCGTQGRKGRALDRSAHNATPDARQLIIHTLVFLCACLFDYHVK